MPFSADIASTPLPLPINGNRVPSSAELAQIRHSLTTSQAAIADINALRDLLGALRSTGAVAAHKANVEACRKRLRHANILPSNVWREIFHWVVALLPARPKHPFYSTHAPLTLSFVCNDWRHSVCQMSALWARISVKDRISPISIRTVGLLGVFLARSFPAPLYVNLSLCKSLSEDTREEWQQAKQVVHMIASQSFRWKKAVISLPMSIWASTVTFPLYSPLLEEVHLKCENEANTVSRGWQQPLFTERTAPKLKSVRIDSFIPSPASVQQFLPWSQLRQFRAVAPPGNTSKFELTEGLSILQWCSELESADLYLHYLPTAITPLLQHFVCPNLRRLQMVSHGRIFDQFSAPHLRELNLWTDAEVTETVASFIQRSPQLTTLKVGGDNLSFISHLPLPMLESLTLTITSWEALIEILDILQNLSSRIFPLLKDATVRLFMEKILSVQRHDQNILMLRFHDVVDNLATSASLPASTFQRINIQVRHLKGPLSLKKSLNRHGVIQSILQNLKDMSSKRLNIDL
ncbi:hypothetical protein DL96DRAFT_268132 [Flagelloscypha sp. PMI_526]|nr:hypothetical protein DL96DRAFT_268132 [Flagelloscypha sp. PMI_526]